MASDSSPLRPTKAVVVDAICDILRPVIRDLRVLELFAGTARVSRALLKEGASRAFAVDRREPPEEMPPELTWLRTAVETVIENGPPETVHVVFLDPPYASNESRRLLPRIGGADWFEEQGLVLVETDRRAQLPETVDLPADLSLMRKRRYGGTRLWLYQQGREEPGYRGDE